MYTRLLGFTERFEILCYNQFAFRKNHSTNLALIDLINKISSSIDQREITAGVFWTSLKPSTLLIMIYHSINSSAISYGIPGVGLEWIKSY
jgi:hypothetical protein